MNARTENLKTRAYIALLHLAYVMNISSFWVNLTRHGKYM